MNGNQVGFLFTNEVFYFPHTSHLCRVWNCLYHRVKHPQHILLFLFIDGHSFIIQYSSLSVHLCQVEQLKERPFRESTTFYVFFVSYAVFLQFTTLVDEDA